MNADRRQGLLEFGAHPMVLKKQHFLGLGHIEKAASPDKRSTAKQTEPDHERGQAAGVAGVWGPSLRAENTTFSWFRCDGKGAASPDERSTAEQSVPDQERGQAAGVAGVWGSSLRAEKTTFSW